MKIWQCTLFTVCLCFLTACESNIDIVEYQAEDEPEIIEEIQEIIVPADRPSAQVMRSMILADMLYEAQQAEEDNRLLAPSRDNAFDKYMEVLSVDQDNEIALQGIQNIVVRYVQLADEATEIGQFDEAEQFLRNAAFINRDSGLITQARQRIDVARQNQGEVHLLDPQGLKEESLEVMTQLSEIAEYIQINDGRFLITARTDEEGRWIYRTMRQAVGGYRLRGNIATGNEPSVQISLPSKG